MRSQVLREFLQGHQGIAHQRQGSVLGSVDFRNVDIDESDGRILKCCNGCGSEVAVASANPDNQISITREVVCRQGAGHSNGSNRLLVFETQGSLARLGLGYCNTCLRRKVSQSVGRLRINNSTPGDDQGMCGGTNPTDSFPQ